MSTGPNPAPLPVIDDPDTRGFWTAASQGQLVVCCCQSCGAVLHLPRAYCHHCDSFGVGWRAVRPLAQLYSWTVAEFQVHDAFPTPYTTVLVELVDAPGVRLAGYLAGRPELSAGMLMRASFIDAGDGATLVQWHPDPRALDG